MTNGGTISYGITGYAYRTDGSRSLYGAESAVLYTGTQAAGTFLSRDTYGGTVDNILSQNRYTYVGNNPVNYADPDGHKAVGTTIIKNTFSALTSTVKDTARQAQERAARSQAKADFVSMLLRRMWADTRSEFFN